jgi:beta-N-acetylhexosaminidase
VIKHIPGHGRATVDSHLTLPRVTVSREVLDRTDFVPFKFLADLPWGMTAHVLYDAIDPDAALTVSARGVSDVVRREIGFDGLLLSDDLSMQALGGTLGERAARALAAGCDIALHCNGRMDEMTQVAGRAGPMTAAAVQRFGAGRSYLARQRDPQRPSEVKRRLAELLPEWG